MKLRSSILAGLFLLVVSAPAFTPPARGQGCAMCYGYAKASNKEGQRAISKGVLVLLAPPFGCMTFGVWLAFRYGRKRDLEQI